MLACLGAEPTPDSFTTDTDTHHIRSFITMQIDLYVIHDHIIQTNHKIFKPFKTWDLVSIGNIL